MKKLTKRVLEARMHDIMNEPTPEDCERMNAAKERAYAEFMQRQKASAQPQKSKKKGYRYYAMVACAIAIAFFVIPVVYTAFFPVTVSNAYSIVRQAGIWINNTFHLGIEIPEPVMEDRFISTPIKEGTFSFSTEEEVSSFIGNNILALDCAETGLTLNSIEVNVLEDNIIHIIYHYSYDDYKLTLSLENIPTDMTLAPHITTKELESNAGPLLFWSTNTMHRAIALIDIWNVQLRADIELNEASKMFETLHIIN